MSAVLRVPLRPQTVAMLQRPIRGRGGFQSLMRRVQLGLRGRWLTVTREDIDGLVRAVKGPSVGGFQRRARDIVADTLCEQLRQQGVLLREDPDSLAKRDQRRGRVLSFKDPQPGLPFEEPL